MHAALRQISGLQRAHHRDVVVARAHALHPQALRDAVAVLAVALDLDLIPADEGLAGEDVADPPAEATTVSLDDVADAFVHAPLAVLEVEAAAIVPQGGHLGLDQRAGGLEQVGDLDRREWATDVRQ